MVRVTIDLTDEQVQELLPTNDKMTPSVILDVISIVRSAVWASETLDTVSLDAAVQDKSDLRSQRKTRKHDIQDPNDPARKVPFPNNAANPLYDGTGSITYHEGLEPTPERNIAAEREYMHTRTQRASTKRQSMEKQFDDDSATVRNAREDEGFAKMAMHAFERTCDDWGNRGAI